MKGFWKAAAEGLKIFSSTDVSQHLRSHQLLSILKTISVVTTVFAYSARGTMNAISSLPHFLRVMRCYSTTSLVHREELIYASYKQER